MNCHFCNHEMIEPYKLMYINPNPYRCYRHSKFLVHQDMRMVYMDHYSTKSLVIYVTFPFKNKNYEIMFIPELNEISIYEIGMKAHSINKVEIEWSRIKLIKKFDSIIPFTPKNFQDKLKTYLSFL